MESESKKPFSQQTLQGFAVSISLLLIGFLIYSNSLNNQFVFDTVSAISNDPDIGLIGEQPLSNWFHILHEDGSRPVWMFSVVINHAIHGLDPLGYRLVNIGIHILSACLLFGIIRRTLALTYFAKLNSTAEENTSVSHSPATSSFSRHALWIAYGIALIWLVHPLNTQSVTYVVQRMESMMAMFFLLALYASIRQATAERGLSVTLWTGLAFSSALLGMGTKEVMVGLPIVLILYDWIFLRQPENAWKLRRWVLLSLCFSTWIYLAYNVLGQASTEDSSAGFGMEGELLNRWTYALSQPGVILHYLQLSFWPDPLVIDYQLRPALPSDTPSHLVWTLAWQRVIPQTIIVSALGLASVWGIYRRQWWGFCGSMFFIVLGPTSSVMPIADLMFEHRMYLPLACVVTFVVGIVYSLCRRFQFFNSTLIGFAVLLPVLGLSYQTYVRNFDYHSPMTIWRDTITHRPQNSRAWYNLGIALMRIAESESNPNQQIIIFEEALHCFTQTVQLSPRYSDAFSGTGDVYVHFGMAEEAEKNYRKAIEIDPSRAHFHYNLGRLMYLTRRFDEANEILTHSIKLDPNAPKTWNMIAQSRAVLGDMRGALEAFEQAIKLDPNDFDYQNNRQIHLKKMADSVPE